MSNIETIVDSLESQISKLLHKFEVLQQTNTKLSEELAKSQNINLHQAELLTAWEEKYETYKIIRRIC